MKSFCSLKKPFVDTIPVMAGYIVLGIGFGIVMRANSFPFYIPVLMSLIMYGGSMQYAAVGLLTGGCSVLTMMLTTLAINARHLFYGISMLEPYRHAPKKPFLIFSLTDETYSLVCQCDYVADPNSYYFWVSFFDYFYWVFGTFLGALVGTSLPFSTEGIDFCLTALFLSVFVQQWIDSKNRSSSVIGIVIPLISLFIFGTSSFLIPSMFLIVLCLLLLQKESGTGHE